MKPPFPAIQGLWQRPTVVNNVETICAVVPIVNEGGEAYAGVGIGRSTGTKLISAGGNITGSNLITGGVITSTGNITAAATTGPNKAPLPTSSTPPTAPCIF
jgi:NADH:ubiquinone oxidoreductase subunit F (NADH-binding)